MNGTIKIFLVLTVVAYFANYDEKLVDDTITPEVCDSLKLSLDRDVAEKGVWQAFMKKDLAFKKFYRMFRGKEYSLLDSKVKNKLSFCIQIFNGKYLKDISDNESELLIIDYCSQTKNSNQTSVCGSQAINPIANFGEDDCLSMDGYNWLPLAAKRAVEDVLNLKGVEIPEAVSSQKARYKACLSLSNVSILDKIKRDMRNMLIRAVTQGRPEDLHEKMTYIKSSEVEQALLSVWLIVVIFFVVGTRNAFIAVINLAQYIILVSFINLHASFAYMILIATTLLGQYKIGIN